MNGKEWRGMIRVEGLSRTAGTKRILKNVGFQVREGTFFGIIGPNGSGKTTLLKAVSGLERPDSGEVWLAGRQVHRYTRKELARFTAVLAQEALDTIGFTVREVLEMGRYPYQNWLGYEKEDPAGLIEGVMKRLYLSEMADRAVESLSGGERQRVALGKTMVQEPTLLLLDEPTTYLDIGHQLQIMDYVRSWQRASGLTVVAVLHDLNLAAQYCDRVMVLDDGQVAGVGTPSEMLNEEMIFGVYGTRPVIMPHPANGVPQILLQPGFAQETAAGRQAPVLSAGRGRGTT